MQFTCLQDVELSRATHPSTIQQLKHEKARIDAAVENAVVRRYTRSNIPPQSTSQPSPTFYNNPAGRPNNSLPNSTYRPQPTHNEVWDDTWAYSSGPNGGAFQAGSIHRPPSAAMDFASDDISSFSTLGQQPVQPNLP